MNQSQPEFYGITKYSVETDGKLHITQDVDVSNQNLEEFPFKIKFIDGSLNCSNNKIKSFKSFPDGVAKELNCSMNEIESFEDYKVSAVSNLNFSQNKIASLEGISRFVEGSLDLSYNLLKDVKNFPKRVKGSVILSGNEELSKLDEVHFQSKIYGDLNICETKIRKIPDSLIIKKGGIYIFKNVGECDFKTIEEFNHYFKTRSDILNSVRKANDHE